METLTEFLTKHTDIAQVLDSIFIYGYDRDVPKISLKIRNKQITHNRFLLSLTRTFFGTKRRSVPKEFRIQYEERLMHPVLAMQEAIVNSTEILDAVQDLSLKLKTQIDLLGQEWEI